MPLTSAGVIPELAPVTYKFKIPQLADYFEGLSTEQSHVVIEGVLNIVFARPTPDQSGLALEGDPLQDDDEDLLDHEQQIITDVAFAIYAHQLGINAGFGEIDGLAMVSIEPEEDFENSQLYGQLEMMFRSILNKMSAEIAEDRFNQDVATLYEEMSFFNRIELYSHNYNTTTEILTVTLAATL
ncbi:hypothetical protein PQD71_gp115 [Kosakonia phage Kc263]|uniref:Uncharacterized protein n=1 Tax=Kosakonia phage Kc263 TaxID=2863194 RepID=A0AAE7WFN1_9CAUD|nr:hypothetical protein PQD71_gp115 [Kosakonia phage Kc263]QYN80008.1 hypothetical protein [Kosakonia phage Kc263]